MKKMIFVVCVCLSVVSIADLRGSILRVKLEKKAADKLKKYNILVDFMSPDPELFYKEKHSDEVTASVKGKEIDNLLYSTKSIKFKIGYYESKEIWLPAVVSYVIFTGGKAVVSARSALNVWRVVITDIKLFDYIKYYIEFKGSNVWPKYTKAIDEKTANLTYKGP